MRMVILVVGLSFACGTLALAQEEKVSVDSLKGGEMVFVAVGEGGFYMDKYETTNEEYAAFLSERGNEKMEGIYRVELGSRYALIEEVEGKFVAVEGFERHPVVEVSWHGAVAYCQWAGKELPTPKEWRRACAGEEGRLYPWGDDYELGRANVYGDKDGYVRTAPVGSFPSGASPYGILDMGGNVWEWTQGGGKVQFLGGGSWITGYKQMQCGKLADTGDSHSYIRGNTLGFRCAY